MSDYLTNQVLKASQPAAVAPRLPSLFEPLSVGKAFVPSVPGVEEASPFPAASAYRTETPAQIAEMPVPGRPSLEAAVLYIPGTGAAKLGAGAPDSRRDPITKERQTNETQPCPADESTLPDRQNSPVSHLASRSTDRAPVRLTERFADSDALTVENSPDESRQHAAPASPASGTPIITPPRSSQPKPEGNQIFSQANQEGGPTAVAHKETPDINPDYPPQPQAGRFTPNRPGPAVSQHTTQAETGADVNPTAVTHEEINQEDITLTMQTPVVKVAAMPSSTQSPKQIASRPAAGIETDVHPIILNRVEHRNDGSTHLVEFQTTEVVAPSPLPLRDLGRVDEDLAFRVNPPVGADRDRSDNDFAAQLWLTEVAAINATNAPKQITLANQVPLETNVRIQQKPVTAKTNSDVRQKPAPVETDAAVGQKPVVVSTSATAVPHHPIAAPDAQKNGWPALFDQPASAATSPTDPAPTIHVTIGRVEVKAVTSPASPANRQRPAPTTKSLDDYLRQRKEERT